jgi:hypothetical protein
MARIRLIRPQPQAATTRDTDDKHLRVFKVSYAGGKRNPHRRPRLTITAEWLERAGFEIGDVVVLSISEGRIVLRTVDDDIVRDLLAE